jgi:hypothetical protein
LPEILIIFSFGKSKNSTGNLNAGEESSDNPESEKVEVPEMKKASFRKLFTFG